MYDLAPEQLGTFDVVVCGSLLLRLRDPLRALTAIRAVCHGRLLCTNQIDLERSVGARRAPLDEVGQEVDGDDGCQRRTLPVAAARVALELASVGHRCEQGQWTAPRRGDEPRGRGDEPRGHGEVMAGGARVEEGARYRKAARSSGIRPGIAGKKRRRARSRRQPLLKPASRLEDAAADEQVGRLPQAHGAVDPQRAVKRPELTVGIREHASLDEAGAGEGADPGAQPAARGAIRYRTLVL